MKLINSVGPNPHVVRMFMAERGIDIPMEELDIQKGLNRQEPYLKTNPAGQTPCLVLDDGSVVTEITAICEYLDEKFPGKKLMGDTPEERAQNRRWTRWVDLNIVEPLGNGFRFSEGLRTGQDRIPRCTPGGPALCGWERIQPCRHSALLLPGIRQCYRPTFESRVQELCSLVCKGRRTPERQSLIVSPPIA